MEVKTAIEDWFTSDEADVAAILFIPAYVPGRMRFQDFDIVGFHTDYFVGPAPDYNVTAHTGWGPIVIEPRIGTEIYFIGLFTPTYGKERNLPVARFGNISRMPSILDFAGDDGQTFQSVAYLAEFHSWGGHSGSPVYFMEPHTVVTTLVDENDQPTGVVNEAHAWLSGFLGLISSHYDIPKRGTVTGELGTVTTNLNSGMAVVVPAEAITNLLRREDLVEQRAEIRKEIEANVKARVSVPTYDFAKAEEFTRADFDSALRRVSRRVTPSQSDQASSET